VFLLDFLVDLGYFCVPRGSVLSTMKIVALSGGAAAVNYARMPPALQRQLRDATEPHVGDVLELNRVHEGDALELMQRIAPNSVALSVWSPPYFVGKSYESHLTFDSWQALIRQAIALHTRILRPGAFLAVNIADILCFRDERVPKIQAHNLTAHRSPISREMVLEAMARHPGMNRYELAKYLGCSEQTIDRRLNGNNIRGGKYDTQTRVQIVGGLVQEWALAAGLYPYDRRVWVKDAAWENSKWTTLSYRAVDEFEYLYIFWKPGVTVVNRKRLSRDEWKEWGARAVWNIPSVRANDDHEAKFPVELPRRAIRLLTDPGDLVLDCFLGSGTTAVAALLERRSWIGIEKEHRSVRLAQQRIDEVVRVHEAAGSSARPNRRSRKGVPAPR
jgi:site-specific DNA-methyltransferase (adenine-specific)